MDITVIAFLGLLLAVAALRIVELQISKRHQKQIVADGGSKVADPKFRWMVLLHTMVLIGAAVEVVFLRRPFIPLLAAISFVFSSSQTPFAGGSFERSASTGTCR